VGEGPDVAVGAVVLAEVDGARCVVLIQRGRPPLQGTWTLPGGRVNRGESLVAAVAREVKEETALDVEVGALVEVVEIAKDDFHYVILDYSAVFKGDPSTLRAGDDAADARWVRLSDVGDFATTDAVKRVIARASSLATA
jgi:ADP-ribose pyrophosphatase YjhB (NUDIX family)